MMLARSRGGERDIGVDPAHAAAAVGVEARGDRDGDRKCAVRGVEPLEVGRERLVEAGDRALGPAAVELVDGLEIAHQPFVDRIARSDLARFGEQPLGLAEIAEIALLERAVGEEFDRIDGRVPLGLQAILQRLEIGLGLGIIAAEIAAVTLGQRLLGLEGLRLHAGKGYRVADGGGRGVDPPLRDAVVEQGTQREQGRAVVRSEPFGHPGEPAAFHRIGRPRQLAARDDAGGHLHAGQIRHRAAPGGGAIDSLPPERCDGVHRIAGKRAKSPDIGDGERRIAAHHRPVAVEAGLACQAIDTAVLHLAEYAVARADREGIAQQNRARLRLHDLRQRHYGGSRQQR